ncbi:MAG: type VI secretion system protein TssA [Desulfovibrio sp.]|jgi:type VI secretion system protein VasJ|nr:type VI secretion system protein TssA [Desulfovibrio sp.]
MVNVSSYATLGTRPIPGDAPAGKDARYEPEYAAVLEEIEKLSFSGQGTTISWPAVEKNAAQILAEQSKDLQIAAYFGVALCRTMGMEGLLTGARTLAGIMETFWETAWPALKRMRGRINAVDWWHGRVYAFVQEQAGQNSTIPVGLGENIMEALGKLDELIASLMPDASPLRDLSAAVRQLTMPVTEKAHEAAPAPQKTPEQKSASGAAQTPTPASPAASDDPAVLRRNFVAAAQAYVTAARRVEPGNASLWQLSRLTVWGAITALPASENGQTRLPAPDTEVLAQARQKLKAGNALEAAVTAEEFFAGAPFCLDAQEVVHKALAALGAQFAEAAQSVADAAAAFAARLPGVEKLTFADGTPFASPQTLIWLRETAASRGGRGNARSSGDKTGKNVFESARALLAQNKLAEAVALLDDAKTQSPATNLHLNACQLRLLCEAGQSAAAGALAEAILQETSVHGLDAWDPESALDALLAVRDAFSMSEAQYAEALREVRRRIAYLRPAAALA